MAARGYSYELLGVRLLFGGSFHPAGTFLFFGAHCPASPAGAGFDTDSGTAACAKAIRMRYHTVVSGPCFMARIACGICAPIPHETERGARKHFSALNLPKFLLY